MTTFSSVDLSKVAAVVRCARKMCGLSKEAVAETIQMSLADYKSLETGQLIPDLVQWVKFCQLTGIDLASYEWGFIDTGQDIDAINKSTEFDLPAKYRKLEKFSVKWILPLIKYFKKHFGVQAFEDFCLSLKIDPDYFVRYDHFLSNAFLSKLLKELKLKEKSDFLHFLNQHDSPIFFPSNVSSETLIDQMTTQFEKFSLNHVYTMLSPDDSTSRECIYLHVLRNDLDTGLNLSKSAIESIENYNEYWLNHLLSTHSYDFKELNVLDDEVLDINKDYEWIYEVKIA